jgi:hypothetical protein
MNRESRLIGSFKSISKEPDGIAIKKRHVKLEGDEERVH